MHNGRALIEEGLAGHHVSYEGKDNLVSDAEETNPPDSPIINKQHSKSGVFVLCCPAIISHISSAS